VVFAAALFAVLGRGIISASIAGLAISYALQVCCSQCHVMLLQPSCCHICRELSKFMFKPFILEFLLDFFVF